VGSEGKAFDLPSPGLSRAEKSYTLEAGVRWHGRHLTVWAFGHYSFLVDFIGRQYVGYQVDGEPAAVRANAADGWLAGVEGLVELRLPRGFSLRAWLSYTRGNLELLAPETGRLEDAPMSRVSPLQGEVALRWSRGRRYFAQAALRFAARQDRLSPGDRNDARICPDGLDRCPGTPGFAVVHLSGGTRIGRHVDVVLRLENVSNAAYKWHGSGVYAPGLSAVTELRLAL
jgi:outer membrane receptor protein involved in Fe transport